MNSSRIISSGVAVLVALVLTSCGSPGGNDQAASAETADQFVARLNKDLADLSLDGNQTGWLQATYINDDSQAVSARSYDRYLAYFNAAVKQSKAYDGKPMSAASKRAIDLLKQGVSTPALLLCFCAELHSAAGLVMQRMIAVLAPEVGAAAELPTPAEWLALADDRRAVVSATVWHDRFAAWAPRREAEAEAVATAAMHHLVAQHIVAHERARDRDAAELERWLRLHIDEEVEEDYRPAGPGRPGPNTTYRRIEQRRYRVRVEEDGEALARDGRCDGLFPLITNDEGLSLEEALGKYKYQPFVEKRHEQLKAVFGVTPMWLKSVARVECLLWLYYVVELVQALLEREVRRRMRQAGEASLALYPEGRESVRPTAELVLGVLEGHRRYRLPDE